MTQVAKNRLREFLPTNMSEFDSLINQVLGPSGIRAGRALYFPAGLWEDEGSYHIELDVPGVAREDIDITLNKGALQIIAERKHLQAGTEGEGDERKGWHEERVYGKVSRTFTLPDSVDPNSIQAELNNGVLRVSIAKTPEAQPQRIEVK
jgi:HSP20 family molecular chaperone IbpA